MGSSLLLWLAAAVWVDWRSRGAAGGVHHGDGDGQAVVQEKEQHLQPSLRGRSTRKSRRASWPGARRARRCSRKATVSNGSLKSCAARANRKEGGRGKRGAAADAARVPARLSEIARNCAKLRETVRAQRALMLRRPAYARETPRNCAKLAKLPAKLPRNCRETPRNPAKPTRDYA